MQVPCGRSNMAQFLRDYCTDLLHKVQGSGYLGPVLKWVLEHPKSSLVVTSSGLVGVHLIQDWLSRPRNLPPGPWGLPFVGYLPFVDFGKFHLDLHRIGKKYGEIYTVYFGQTPCIILNSYSAIKEGFLRRGNLFAGRPDAPIFSDIMQEEVFMKTYSVAWKLKKKFGETSIRKFGGPRSGLDKVIMKECEYIVDTLQESAGKPVCPKDVFYLTTSNVMLSMIYGITYDHDDPRLLKVRDDLIDWNEGFNDQNPGSELLPTWAQRIIYKDENKLLDKATTSMRELCESQIEEYQHSSTPDTARGFMEDFLIGRGIDAVGGMRVFADTIGIYTPDSVDTLTRLMQWCVLYLAYFQDAQRKIQDLIEEVVGTSRMVSIDERVNLGLLESFLWEVQRHCNFTAYSFCHSTEETNAMFRGYNVPRGVPVLANFYAVHMDPEIHPEPTKFKVDRFINEEGVFHKTDNVFTFSIGSRHCPGEIMSRTELFLTMANIAQQFDITFPEGQPKPSLEMKRGSFFKICQDFKVIFTPRGN